MTDFPGFAPQAPAFLAELAANNDTGWFNARKDDYRDLIQTPLRRLFATMAPAMLEIDPGFDASPMGGAISRIRRDTRFSRDKSPYRVKQWMSFRRAGEGWQSRPTFFLAFAPGGYRYGLGYYAASPATMTELRAAIAARPGRFAEAMAAAADAGFTLTGEAYRRPRLPKGMEDALPTPVLGWFGLKSGVLIRERPMEPLFFSPDLVTELTARLARMAPLYHLLSGQSGRTDPP
ncbi:hypothetical protein H261_14850 [Paramagnetospirillum caucaseum]|uniref:TIGR02453 family protein n=1 Tax=Paramagnetospirillum caucaseum TaxID=1244869 RepID=M2ZPE6_9PROT|nr:DUF2461 domain-containing protein [Paramagnetospirillum caucaseum]EME69167.1 hypothetical protein H261_14850 [Paramagnetospirillum caucaseum]